uniref:FluG n=1 Tax=Purpureocillium lavendulum TaxID=1247861 RepID=A0A5J6CNU1_9HYPO|nr:FluG [Purpureocillium lavendulum]
MTPREDETKNNAESNKSKDLAVLSTVQEFLENNPRVQFIRFQWQDYSGVLRARVVTLQHAFAVIAGKRYVHVAPLAFNCLVDNSALPDITARGIHLLVADWSSLRTRQHLDPLYASVMCSVVDQTPRKPGPNASFCPRRGLAEVVRKATEALRVDFLVGFEVEFEIMKATANGEYVPCSVGLGNFAVSGLRDPSYVYVEEAVQTLLEAGVKIEAFQSEGRRGQYEIALGPLPPVQAVDQLVLVHDTIKHVFARQGLVATMSPRPVALRRQSTGQHTHISISPPGKEELFLAGILRRLPQLCAFCLPYDISYERIQPCFAGTVVAWGTENPWVPVRKIHAGHWELRCVDATANMYLALAAILSAGMLGCFNEEALQWQDTSFDAQAIPSSGMPMPRTLQNALALLEENSHELESMMCTQVITHYLRVKKAEASRFHEMGPQDARNLLVDLF